MSKTEKNQVVAAATTETDAGKETLRERLMRIKGRNTDPNPQIPRGNILARNRYSKGGWIIPLPDAINAGWFDREFKNTQVIDHEFNTTGAAQVLYLPTLRFVVIAATPMYKEAREGGEFMGVVEEYHEWEDYDRQVEKACRNYLLLLLDENYQPLHKRALHYKGSGVSGYSFSCSLLGKKSEKGFYHQIEDCFAALMIQEGLEFEPEEMCKTRFTTNKELHPEEVFHSCSVATFYAGAEKHGDPQDPKKQSYCATVARWDIPTPDTVFEFYREELRPRIEQMYREAFGNGWSRKVLNAVSQTSIVPYVEPDYDAAYVYTGEEGSSEYPPY